MKQRGPVTHLVADALARLALRFPFAEQLLAAGTRRPLLRRHLHLGAIALGYPRVLQRRELRIAQMAGYRFYVNVGESLGVEPFFFQKSGTSWLTPAIVRPGDWCVDAGANVGHYTFHCANLVGSQGRVFAFEPNPEFASLIQDSIALNDFESNVVLSTRALWSSTNDIQKFYISVEPTNSGTSSLINHGWFLSDGNTIGVRTVRFDDFIGEAKIDRLRLVKIDVERAEDAVIDGAASSLAEGLIDYLIIEMHCGSRAEELLGKAGYSGYLLVPERRQLLPLSGVSRRRFGDYLFVRAGLNVPGS